MTVAVIAALLAGLSFAVGSVLQQSAAREAPNDEALSLRLLADLVHRKRWLMGISSDAGSFALQAVALAFGPLALVQPLIVSGLLFALPLAMKWRHQRLGPQEWAGTVSVAGGLALFLALASPTAGHPDAGLKHWLAVLIGVAAVMGAATLAGRRVQGTARPALFGVAAGTAFGLLAALTKTSTHLLGEGAGTFFSSWQPYGMAVVAVLGAVVQQSAFQAGPLAASLPVMDALEPTVAVAIGVFVFDERLTASPLAVTGEVIGILMLVAGIVLLDRSPAVLRLQEQEPGAEDGRRSGTKPDESPDHRSGELAVAGACGTDEAG